MSDCRVKYTWVYIQIQIKIIGTYPKQNKKLSKSKSNHCVIADCLTYAMTLFVTSSFYKDSCSRKLASVLNIVHVIARYWIMNTYLWIFVLAGYYKYSGLKLKQISSATACVTTLICCSWQMLLINLTGIFIPQMNLKIN